MHEWQDTAASGCSAKAERFGDEQLRACDFWVDRENPFDEILCGRTVFAELEEHEYGVLREWVT